MAIAPGLAIFQVALLASWFMPSPVASFAGVQTHRQKASATISFGNNIQRKNREFHPASINARYLGAKNDDNEEEEDGDPLMNDQREGMSDAFSALDSLSANDFDNFLPLSSTSNEGSDDSTDGSNMEESAKLFMEMQAELSTLGEDGVYDDMLGDLSGDNPKDDAPKSYLNTDEEDVTGLGQALDEAADLADASPVLNDADGFGTLDSTTDNPTTPLTTADVSNDILTQEIEPSLSIDEFMASALQEAVTEIDIASEMLSSSGAGRTVDIAKTAEELLEDEELRKDIESLFDTAGAKLRLEVEAMKEEQVRVLLVVLYGCFEHMRYSWETYSAVIS